MFRVLRGTPTAEELAALVGAVLIRSRSNSDGPPRRSAWVAQSRPGVLTGAGLPARIGPDGWRASALPR